MVVYIHISTLEARSIHLIVRVMQLAWRSRCAGCITAQILVNPWRFNLFVYCYWFSPLEFGSGLYLINFKNDERSKIRYRRRRNARRVESPSAAGRCIWF
jgi:hypothetical protein